MKEKNKIIIVISLLIIVIVGTVLSIYLLNKSNKKIMTEKEKNIYENLTYINNASLIGEYQKSLEDNYIKNFKEEEHKLDNPLIINNPYEIAPLSALIMFKTDEKVSGTVTIKGKDEAEDLTFEFDEEKIHYITIWGLYENYDNKVVIETNDGNKKELIIDLRTDVTEEIEFVEVLKNSKKLNNFYVLDTPLGTSFNLIDSEGNIRATFNNAISKFIKELDNGHILISDGNFDLESKSNGLIEIDLAGKVYNYYKLDYGMSYGSKVLDNGNILYMTQNEADLESFDTIVEIDSKGKLIRTISIYDLMKNIDSNYMESIKDKWGYISGIDYNKEKNEIVVSLWYSSAVVGIDYKQEKINWILSDPSDLSDKFQNYLLIPSTEDFVYPKGPYAIEMTNDGFSLMVTNWDINDSLSCSSIIDRKSYVANYKITDKTILETSSFGKNENFFSYALGDYNKYDDYSLVLFGRELANVNYNDSTCMLNNYWDLYSKLLLIDKNGEVIFDAKINRPQVIAEIYNINKKLTNSFMDAKSYNFEFKGNKEEELVYNDYKELLKNSSIYSYGIGLEDNKLTIDANENEKLLLVSSNNKIYRYEYVTEELTNYYLLNTHNEYFRVYIEKNGEIYNTGAYLYI